MSAFLYLNMNQTLNDQKDKSSTTAPLDEYRFTETFYGQLVTNLDEVFEELFFAPLEEPFEKDSQVPAQVTYDETTLRMLFAEIASVYVEPVKLFVTNLEEKKATISESQTACYALMDISCAANSLGLSTLCNKIALLITEINQWSCLTGAKDIASKKDNILLVYGELAELLPQTFTIKRSQRSNTVIKVVPSSSPSGVYTAINLKPLSSDSTFYHYPPRLHQHIDIVEQSEKGQSVFWFKDTRSNRYFKAGKRERDVIVLIDGSRTLKEICETIKQQMNLNVKPAQLTQIVTKLDAIGLIDGVEDKNLNKKPPSNYNSPLNIMDTKTIRLTNPDNFFTKLDSLLPWVFTKAFVFTSLILMVLVMLTVSSQYNEFYNHGQRILKDYGLVFNYICFLIVVSLHEIGHGLTCKHYGGRVTDVGVIIFGLVLPGAYCNISDIYLFKNKWHRVYALLAGLYTQFLIATIAAIGALIFNSHTIISDLCYIVFFSATASTAINLVPLIKLDGYYVLTNLLDEYNLQTQAITYVSNIIKWWFYGSEMPKQSLSQSQKTLYLIYGSLSLLLIRVLPIFFLFIMINNLLSGNFSFFTLIFAPLLISRFYKVILGYCFSFPTACYRILNLAINKNTNLELRIRAIAMVAGVFIVLGLLLMKWPEKLITECRFSLLPNKSVPVTFPYSGIVDKLLVKDQEMVITGQAITTIVNYNNEIELSKLESKLLKLQHKQKTLQETINQQQSIVEQSVAYLKNYQEQAQEAMAKEQLLNQEKIEVSLGEKIDGEIDELYTNLEKSQALAHHYKTIEEKQRTLLASNLTSQIVVEKAVFDYQVALKTQQEAETKLATAILKHHRLTNQLITKMDITKNKLIAAKAKLDKLTSQFQQLVENIKDTKLEYELLHKQQQEFQIKSPCRGVIQNDKLVQNLGQPIKQGSLLCKVVDTSELRVEIEVPEWQITKIVSGQILHLYLKDWDRPQLLAKVQSISNEVIVKPGDHRVYLVYAITDNKNSSLKDGLSAVAHIDFTPNRGVAIIFNKLKYWSDYPAWWPN